MDHLTVRELSEVFGLFANGYLRRGHSALDVATAMQAAVVGVLAAEHGHEAVSRWLADVASGHAAEMAKQGGGLEYIEAPGSDSTRH